MELFIESFTSRNYATLIWLTGFMSLFLVNNTVRESFVDVLKAVFQIKLALPFGLYGFYVYLLCWIAYRINMWDLSHLKDTIIWLLISGIVILGRSIGQSHDTKFFKRVFLDNFKLILVVEFMTTAYTFALWKELLLLPWLTMLSLIQISSEKKSEHEKLKNFATWLMIITVLLILLSFVLMTIENNGKIASMDTLKSVLLPIWLTIFSIPAYYFIYCYARWESSRYSIDLKTYYSDEVKGHARKLFRRYFFFRPDLIHQAVRMLHASDAKSEKDIWNIIQDVLANERRRNKPLLVAPENGWSPYAAEKFLEDVELKTADYHKNIYDEEWFAESNHKYINRDGFGQTVIYSIEGSMNDVTSLKLKATINEKPKQTEAIEDFSKICALLVERSMYGVQIPDNILRGIANLNDSSKIFEYHKVVLNIQRFDGCNILELRFLITVKD